MKGRVLGILVLIAWGIVKMPVEGRLEKRMESARLGGFRPSANLRQQAGQAGFIAALGGLRAAVADMLWIRANVAWQDVQYGRMKLLFDTCTAMQPRRVSFWDLSAWHMAWNGAAHVDQETTDADQRLATFLEFFKTGRGILTPVLFWGMNAWPAAWTAAARFENRLADAAEHRPKVDQFFKLGEDYLLRGIENNPDSWELYDRLGYLYRDKFKDMEKASLAYEQATQRPGHLEYTRRFAAYYLAEVPGREREAYARLLALFRESEHEWLPTLFRQIQKLEVRLGIPDGQRIWHDVVRFAATPGNETSAYTALRDLIQTGASDPAVLDAAQTLEQKMDIPAERRVKLPEQDQRP